MSVVERKCYTSVSRSNSSIRSSSTIKFQWTIDRIYHPTEFWVALKIQTVHKLMTIVVSHAQPFGALPFRDIRITYGQ